MRAVSRWGLVMVAAGLALGPESALAQSAPQPISNTPAADSVGPKELQNFSLGGTVTRPADTTPITATQPSPRRTQARPAPEGADQSAATQRNDIRAPARPDSASARAGTTKVQPQQAPAVDLAAAASATPASVPQPGFTPTADAAPAPLEPAQQKILLWPWLLLAVVLCGAGALLLRRRRSRETLVDGFNAFAAPEPAPALPRAAVPKPATPPPPAPQPASEPAKPVGIVSSRLRPWLELTFNPIGCVVDDDRVALEFEIQLSNSGSAPARDILVEASMFNAGATQEQDIGAFFAKPLGQGERIELMAPLQQVSIRTSLVAPRQNIQIFEVGGRQVFVPLAAFNVIYRLPNGGGQTSLAYMLGRETKGDKLGPLRADLGPRTFTGLGIRPLPIGVRT